MRVDTASRKGRRATSADPLTRIVAVPAGLSCEQIRKTLLEESWRISKFASRDRDLLIAVIADRTAPHPAS